MGRPGIRSLVWVAVFALIAVACGDDDSLDTSLEVTATDFEFTPNSYRLPANTEASLTFKNDGAVEHEWVIMTSPIDNESEFEEDLVLWEEEVEAGEEKTVTIPPLEPGTYQIICGLEGHFTAGMEGELVVES